MLTSVSGGLSSVAGGGKFGNGAVTAAFGYLYNGWLGRRIGSRVGASLGGAACAGTGPGAIACGAGGYVAGGQVGSDIEDWLTDWLKGGGLWNENASDQPDNGPVPGSSKQFGKKFGQHNDPNLPGYRTHNEYKDLANKVYNDRNATWTQYGAGSRYPGETHIQDGAGNLLRLDPKGNFRSLFPKN